MGRGLSSLDPTLSGKTLVALIREAMACGYRILLNCFVIGSATQAIARVALPCGWAVIMALRTM